MVRSQVSVTPDRDVDDDGRISQELVDSYRENGFVRIRGILSPGEVERYRAWVEPYLTENRERSLNKDSMFTQFVSVWKHSEIARQVTLHPRIAAVAEQLAGVPLRLWHDQLAIKEPRSGTATEFHQDRPIAPHAAGGHVTAAWIALVDVPPERGCMTFLPGSHRLTELGRSNPREEGDLFRAEPELRWFPRVTVPLRAGDCTFHDSYVGHMALPNTTDLARLVHITAYMDEATTYSGAKHPITDPLGLKVGARLDGDSFPRTRA